MMGNTINNSSLIKMEIEGQTILWTGDIDKEAFEIPLQDFGSLLESDILQMAHHGWNGSIAFYEMVNPIYALLPINFSGGYQGTTASGTNKWLYNKAPRLRQVICTEYGTFTISLPYEPQDGTYNKLPMSNTVPSVYPETEYTNGK